MNIPFPEEEKKLNIQELKPPVDLNKLLDNLSVAMSELDTLCINLE